MNRPNGRLRRMIAPLEQQFRERFGWFGEGTDRPCASLHVRHGDKITELVRSQGHAEWSDRVTFNHSLAAYVSRAADLMKAASGEELKLVFLMTDDSDVIDASKKIDGITFMFVDSHRPVRGKPLLHGHAHLNHGKNATLSFAQLFMAVQLASSCEVMVGNTMSSISKLMLFHGCFYNSRCPTFHDFGPVCGIGYHHVIGHKLGSGDSAVGGSRSDVDSIQVCADLCNANHQCRSFEYSPTQRKCIHHTVARPANSSSLLDYRYCIKVAVPRPSKESSSAPSVVPAAARTQEHKAAEDPVAERQATEEKAATGREAADEAAAREREAADAKERKAVEEKAATERATTEANSLVQQVLGVEDANTAFEA